VLGVVMLVPVPTGASAQSAAEAPDPSVNQYVESVPGARGGAPASSHDKPAYVAPSVRKRIAEQGGEDKATLDAITRSQQLGAPPPQPAPAPRSSGSSKSSGSSRSSKSSRPSKPSRSAAQPASDPTPVRAASAATVDGSGPWLLAGLIAIAVAAAVLARRRRA
jgi:hypothetical protein